MVDEGPLSTLRRNILGGGFNGRNLKAIKEKKEQEEALRKEIEREEAEKREKEEQARIVEEAKAKLAAREAKKKK